jgi:hypothetical protein
MNHSHFYSNSRDASLEKPHEEIPCGRKQTCAGLNECEPVDLTHGATRWINPQATTYRGNEMRKKETSSTEAAAILLTITGCLAQLAPVMNTYPVGGIILTAIIAIVVIGVIYWRRGKRDED